MTAFYDSTDYDDFSTEDAEPKKPVSKIDAEIASGYISAGGELSQNSDKFEERPSQIALLKEIAKCFNENLIGVFEAGTGVGKSYAYLIPAIFWAVKNNDRVIVSTGTINLQQQLCQKDIPAVQKIIGQKINFMLLKGRQNYVCLRRLEDAVVQKELFDDAESNFQDLYEWAKSSKTGNKSDLPFMPRERDWSRINSESDACLKNKCPFFSECFVMKVRKEAASANLIVVNHHLLFADIEARLSSGSYDDASVLPPYRHIIFDEAHGIENAATSFFSESFNRFSFFKQLNRLYRKRKNNATGLLCNIAIMTAQENIMADAYDLIDRVRTDIENLEKAGLDLLENDYNLRLYEKTHRAFGPVITLSSSLASDLTHFTTICRKIIDEASETVDIPPEDTTFWEAKVILRRIEDSAVVLHDFSQWQEKAEYVFWIQKKAVVDSAENTYFVTFTRTPLDISPLMNTGVFEPMKSVVCTSATLKTGRDFSYYMGRHGLFFQDQERVQCKEFASPFPYEKNMLFAVPKDAPFVDDDTFQSWIEKAIVRLIESANGRTLVLFTSYESLKSAYNATVSSMRNFPGEILRQGSDDNSRLLETFKKDVASVLFATDSFWQGIDVPGEALSQVIIVKLPFTVPNDPIFMARAEAIEKSGESSFMSLSLPEAVIKFRQGIGRLIRTKTDRGSVVLLDKRIYEKRYGTFFEATIPDCKKIYEPLSEVVGVVERFLE